MTIITAIVIILAFIIGRLWNYIEDLLGLGMQHLQNKQTLSTSKMQFEIDGLCSERENSEVNQLQPAIGFHYESEQEEDVEE